VLLSGHGLTLRYRCAGQAGTNWSTYRVLLRAEAGWEREDGLPALAEELWLVLSDLISVEIVGQLSGATEACALDNVDLLAPCTSEPPRLQVRVVGQSAIELAWPEEASCFQLETADTLSAPNWSTDFTVLDSSVAGGLIRVTVPVSGAGQFFRLRKP
jgi:hypothetical protein